MRVWYTVSKQSGHRVKPWRQGLSFASLMKNPMFLLVAMTVLMAWLAPKMLEGMDAEAIQAGQHHEDTTLVSHWNLMLSDCVVCSPLPPL